MIARWVGLFLLLIAAVLGISNVAAQDSTGTSTPSEDRFNTPTPDPACAFPDGLRDIGLYEKALEHYERMVATEGATCAADAYIVLAQTATAEAEAKKDSTPEADLFAPARNLDREGFESEARASVVKVLEANTRATIPSDLVHLDNNANNDELTTIPTSWSGLDKWWESFTNWVANWYGLLLVVLVLLVWLWRNTVHRKQAHVAISPFDQALAKGNISIVMADLVQSSYEEVRKADRPANPRLAQDAPPAVESTAIVELVPNVGPLLANILGVARNLWRRRYTLSGALIDDNKRGAGLALTLQKGNHVVASQSLWFSEYFKGTTLATDGKGPLDIDYLAMAETAAIWLHDKLADEQDPYRLPQRDLDQYSATWRRWEAYALFRNSVRIAARGDSPSALRLLERSLSKDPRFLPALLNHHVLKITDVDEKYTPDDEATAQQKKEKREDLIKLVRKLEEIARCQGGNTPDRLRLSALYNKEATIDYLAGWPRKEPAGDEPRSEIQVLLDYVNGHTEIRLPPTPNPDGDAHESKARDVRSNRESPVLAGSPREGNPIARRLPWVKKKHTQRLREYAETLEAYEYPIRAMEVTIAIRKDISAKKRDKVGSTLEDFIDSMNYARLENEYSALFYYSQACMYAAAFSSGENAEWGRTSLHYLKMATDLNSGFKKWAPNDPSLTPLRVGLSEQFQEVVKQPEAKANEPPSPVLTEHVHYFRRWRERESEIPDDKD